MTLTRSAAPDLLGQWSVEATRNRAIRSRRAEPGQRSEATTYGIRIRADGGELYIDNIDEARQLAASILDAIYNAEAAEF
ncbi:MAG: hypothetical protein ABSF33_04900 [Acidimicrobiales bacterium]|jgi:hypothetical protein